MYLNFVQHIMIFKYLRYLRQYWNSRWHEQTCKTRRRVGIHCLGLSLGLRRGKGKQGKRGWLTSLECHGPTLPAYPLLGIRWPSHLVVVCPHHREGQWRARRRFVVVTSLSCAHIPQRGEGQ